MLMVAGLLERSFGDIIVGRDRVDAPITDVGIAFQDHLLLEFRTAFDNVMLHADIRGLDRAMIASGRRSFSDSSGSRMRWTSIHASSPAACASASR